MARTAFIVFLTLTIWLVFIMSCVYDRDNYGHLLAPIRFNGGKLK